MTIALSEDTEARLKREADRRGIDAEEYAKQLIEKSLPPPPPRASRDQATIDILDALERETATDDPEEIARQQQEGEEFMRGLARNRIEMEGPNARRLWP